MRRASHIQDRIQSRRFAHSDRRGFTLLEIIVSFAILAIVSVSVLAAVLGMAGVENRNNQMRSDSSAVEGTIATDAEPSQSRDGVALPMGDYSISSTADTYNSGIGSYTVLNPGSGPSPQNGILDGDVSHAATYKIITSGYYRLEVWGASGGGNGTGVGVSHGGRGGYATGVAYLEKDDTLYLHAGGEGATGNTAPLGGENGGGNGGTYDLPVYLQGGGGGGSDVRVNTDSLYARIIVAGGGGGAGCATGINNYYDLGGYGGGARGNDGEMYLVYCGLGGTQNSGGGVGSVDPDMVNGPGTFGQGGTNALAQKTGGGGGGGWYGGGGASYAGGGGGSGWVFHEASYNAWVNSTDKSNYLLDSAYWLKDATLLGGDTAIPNPRNNDSKEIGMSGNGYVRVTWIGATLP